MKINLRLTTPFLSAATFMLLLVACSGESQIADTDTPEAKVVTKVEVEPSSTKEPSKPEPTEISPTVTVTTKATELPSPPTQVPLTSTPTPKATPIDTPTLDDLSLELNDICQLDSQSRRVSCKLREVSPDSILNWSEKSSGMSSTGEDFEFPLYDPIASEIIVTLEECISSSCNTVEFFIDTSHLESATTDTENADSIGGTEVDSSSADSIGGTEVDSSSAVRTMQSEYSQGQCDPNGVNYLDSPPMNTDDVTFIKPMGAFGGDHITPIDHIYVNYEPGTSHNVFTMADGHIVHIGHTGEDHRVIIEYSCDLYSIYIHIHELDPAIESQVEWVSPKGNSKGRSYSRIPVRSGMVIGRQIGNHSFDLSVVDTSVTLPGFVNLESYRGEFWKHHCVDPYDYWKGDFRQELLDKTIIVNEDTPGGKIDYDVDGKLIGNWFEKDTGGYSGERTGGDYHGVRGHLAIVYSSLVRDSLVISIGSFLDSGARRFFIKDNTPDPVNIGPSSGLVRYELLGSRQEMDREGNCCDTGFEVISTGERWYGDTYPEEGLVATLHENPTGVVLVEMLDERTIKVEMFDVWDGDRRKSLKETSEFTDNFKIYVR